MSQDFDLFGNPVRLGKGLRGRPSHVPDVKSTNRVKLGILLDWTETEIAHALRITDKTLRKYYSRLLQSREVERYAAEAGMIERLIENGMGGNTSALKLAYERIDRAREDRWMPQQRVDDQTGKPVEKLGKKQQAQRAAEDGSLDDWLRDDAAGSQQPN